MRPYREYTPDQAFLLPPSLADLLPEDDPVLFLREVIGQRLDLGASTSATDASEASHPTIRR